MTQDNQPPGATPEEWSHWDLVLGLTEDLLPVVSNAAATISPQSSIREPGKLPSIYNARRQLAGFAAWTQYRTGPADVARWVREPDYGICIQTRLVRAIDVDVEDAAMAAAILESIERHGRAMPRRARPNSSKFLLAFALPGDLAKRRLQVNGGIIEFLANGQQFVAVGTHPSGVRYAWDGGLPDDIPTLTLEEFEDVWRMLQETFGTGDGHQSSPSSKSSKLASTLSSDPVARFLIDQPGRVRKTERDGRLHIVCPWESEHTSESSDSATTYWPAHTGGYVNGHFACLHAHCEHRTDQEFLDALGYAPQDEFAPIEDLPVETPEAKPEGGRFRVMRDDELSRLPSLDWIVKGVLPRADLGVVFGASGSGKSFFVLDLAISIALGKEWRGRRTRSARVVYVAAEGAAGVRKRILAYKQHHGLKAVPMGVIEAAPNLRERAQAVEVAEEIQRFGGADLVIVDTLAQTMPGANENAAEDVGKVLEHCRGIRRATGAMVLLVHHSGKDLDRGARGWSGLKAAADVEIEVVRAERSRSATVTKLKDAEDGAEFAFGLEEVVLGVDGDGDEVTSCVVVPVEGSVAKKAKVGVVETIVLSELDDLGGAENRWVSESEVFEAAGKAVPMDPGKRDTRPQRIRRALRTLVQGGQIEESPAGIRRRK